MPRKKWMKSTFQNVQQFGSTMSLKILNIQYSIRQYILSCLKLIIQTFCSPLTTKLLKCYLILTNGANFRKLFLPKIPNFTPSQGNSTHTPSAVRSLLSDTMLCRQVVGALVYAFKYCLGMHRQTKDPTIEESISWDRTDRVHVVFRSKILPLRVS